MWYTVVTSSRHDLPGGKSVPSVWVVRADGLEAAVEFAKEDAVIHCAEEEGASSVEDSLWSPSDFEVLAVFVGELQNLLQADGLNGCIN